MYIIIIRKSFYRIFFYFWMRPKGCVPSEDELNEFVNNVIDKEHPQTVSLNIFLPHLEKQILAFRFI